MKNCLQCRCIILNEKALSITPIFFKIKAERMIAACIHVSHADVLHHAIQKL